MDEEKVSRISVSIQPKLLKEFDRLAKRIGYDRSKAVQSAMRNFIVDHKRKRMKGTGTGAIVMVYDHRIRELTRALTSIQHKYEDMVRSSSHVHLDEENCLEVIAVRGSLERMSELEKELMRERGVKQLKLVLVYS